MGVVNVDIGSWVGTHVWQQTIGYHKHEWEGVCAPCFHDARAWVVGFIDWLAELQEHLL